jgi:hypothetical protein
LAPDPNDMTVYSEADGGVAPPKILYKRLTASPPEPRGYPSTIELVIAKDGSVEQVKLVSPSKLMHDVMLLHAAKAWQFDPASRDGYPVRYRLVLNWDGTP